MENRDEGVSVLPVPRMAEVSMRDYFAAAALSAVDLFQMRTSDHSGIAELAYSLADAMLRARQ